MREKMHQMNIAGWSKTQRRTIVENFGFEKAHKLARKSTRKVREQAARKEYHRRVAEWDLGDRIDTIIDDLEFSEPAQRRLFRAGMGNIPKASRPSLEDLLSAMTAVIIMKSRSKDEAIRRLEKLEKLAEPEEKDTELEEDHEVDEPRIEAPRSESKKETIAPRSEGVSKKPVTEYSRKLTFWERLFGPPEHLRKRR